MSDGQLAYVLGAVHAMNAYGMQMRPDQTPQAQARPGYQPQWDVGNGVISAYPPLPPNVRNDTTAPEMRKGVPLDVFTKPPAAPIPTAILPIPRPTRT